jgi:hypothetical protein
VVRDLVGVRDVKVLGMDLSCCCGVAAVESIRRCTPIER